MGVSPGRMASLKSPIDGAGLGDSSSLVLRARITSCTGTVGKARRITRSINREGHAAVLVDLKAFTIGQIDELETATGLSAERTAGQPPSGRDTLIVTNPPYVKWGRRAFYPGAAAFGLWSVTHWTPFILVVVVALAVMLPLLLLAKMATPSRAEMAQEARDLLPKLQQAVAMGDEWLAQHPEATAPAAEEPTQKGALKKESGQENDLSGP